MQQIQLRNENLTKQNDDEFVAEALKIHNEYRRNHGVGPLHLNKELTKLAQQWGKNDFDR